ncbi:MAG: flagellar biosynthesis anti-sigma factor FlgM [Steroidobacteraceae bacterium]
MTNKISGYNSSEALTPVQGSGSNSPVADKTQPSTPAASPQATPAADQVTLTGSARTLQKLSAALANAPVVDSAKVASVKQAVQNGTYTVNNGSVADKLLQFDSELK